MKILLSIAAGLIMSSAAQLKAQKTYTLSPGTDNIQATVDAAQPGDIIKLNAGTYKVTKAVLIYKRLQLTGAGSNAAGTIIKKINGDSNVSAIRISSKTGAQTLPNQVWVGNLVIDGGNCVGAGISLLSGANNCELNNLWVHHCGRPHANSDNNKGAGILTHGVNLTRLIDCRAMQNYGVGISQHSSTNSLVMNCSANRNGLEGITIDLGTNGCIVNNCEFPANEGGVGSIGIDDSNNVRIRSCTVGTQTKGRASITFQNNVDSCDDIHIRDCNIAYNPGYAIQLVQREVTNLHLADNVYRNSKTTPMEPLSPNLRNE
jgi:hypothetical protein